MRDDEGGGGSARHVPHPCVLQRANQVNGPVSTNQRSRLGSNRGAATRAAPPVVVSTARPEADPYAWVEEEEEEEGTATTTTAAAATETKKTPMECDAKLSEFAVREEDESDDGIKPWFWPASREVAKASATTPQSQPPVCSANTPRVGASQARRPSAPQAALTNGSATPTPRDKKEEAKKEVSHRVIK